MRNVCILFFIFVCLWGCYNYFRATKNREDYNSINQQIEHSQELTGCARAENKSAREAISAAKDRADEATTINQQVTKQLDNCSELLSEIRADNRRAKQLLSEIIGSD